MEWVKEGGSTILKKPCVRNALMAGIATGTLMGIHKFRVGSESTAVFTESCSSALVVAAIEESSCC